MYADRRSLDKIGTDMLAEVGVAPEPTVTIADDPLGADVRLALTDIVSLLTPRNVCVSVLVT